DVEHLQRLVSGDEAVRRARRQPQEVARREWILLAVEYGDAAPREDEVILLRDAVVTDGGAAVRLDADAVDRAGSGLVAADQRLDRVRPEAAHAFGVAAGPVDQPGPVRHARMSFTTTPLTSVRRKSRPL